MTLPVNNEEIILILLTIKFCDYENGKRNEV